MKLLVVDDDAEIREALFDILEDAGFEVTPTSTAEHALTIAVGSPPDVLVTDLDLGAGMGGVDLGIEARRRWPTLPVVYISGRPWLMNGHPLCNREAFIRKPFHRKELLGAVRAVAAGSTTRVTQSWNGRTWGLSERMTSRYRPDSLIPTPGRHVGCLASRTFGSNPPMSGPREEVAIRSGTA